MATKINKITELPDWFDISSYESVNGFSSFDWWLELSARAAYYITPYTRSFNKEKQNYFGWRTGLPTFQDVEHLDDWKERLKDVSIEFQGEVVFTGPVTDGEYYQSRKVEWAREHIPICLYKTPEDIKTPLSTGMHILTVDFFAPDKVLENEFKRLLRETRENMLSGVTAPILSRRMAKDRKGIPKAKIHEYNNTHFKKWYKCGLLPLLDLRQWAKLSDGSITNKVYGEAVCIFDEKEKKKGRGADSVIEKTTRKHAANVRGIIDVLKHQIRGRKLTPKKSENKIRFRRRQIAICV